VPKKYPVSAYGVSMRSLFHLSVGACLPELYLKIAQKMSEKQGGAPAIFFFSFWSQN
jgi:hypothetical protein